MEENKQILEFIAPEVKVVSVTSQRVLCQSETKAEAQFDFDEATGMHSYKIEDL